MAAAGIRERIGIVIATIMGTLVVTTGVAGGAITTSAAPPPGNDELSAPVASTIKGGARPHDGGRVSAELRPATATTTPAPTSERPSGLAHVLVSGADTQALEDAIAANGGRVQAAIPGKIDAFVPADRLAPLGHDPQVAFVEPAQQYHPNAGTITSEGVTDTVAYGWHNNGKQGAGVNVAILDPGGFQGYDTELGDELPASVTKKNFCGSNPDVFDSTFTQDPHGTEVAAIVHDMAPAAGIVLMCAVNDVGLVQAKDFILSVNADSDPTNDIRVVNGSFGNPIAARGDGSGAANTGEGVVRTLRLNNVLYVAAAGNEGQVHYAFSPAGPDLPTQATQGQHAVAWAPSNYEDGFTVGPNRSVTVRIKWDAWTGPAQDFDLYIFDTNGLFVTGSGLDQIAGAPPIEGAVVTNFSGSPATFYAVIDRYQASANPRFDTYVMYASSELVSAVGSVSVPASSPYAMAVGAYCVSNHQLEPFSGQGPTIDGRVKPDIAGPDGTTGQVTNSITPYGSANSNCFNSGFTGTSASAPHVAGAAALLFSVQPGLTINQAQSALQSMSVDAGPAGFDNQFGAGRLTLQLRAAGGPTATTSLGLTVSMVKGTDQALWMLDSTGTWTRLGGVLASDPEMTSMPSGRLDVFVRGVDNALWHMQSNNNGTTWGAWESLGGVLFSGPGAVSWGTNRIDVFARGQDSALWHQYYNGAWAPWWQPLGGIITADPDVASWGVNRLDLFVRGQDNALWHRAWGGSSWFQWDALGGVITTGPGAGSATSTTVDAVARGGDGQLWAEGWTGTQWGAWTPLGGATVGDPDIASTTNQLDLVVDGIDGLLWHRKRTGGSWGAWAALSAPSFGPPGSPP